MVICFVSEKSYNFHGMLMLQPRPPLTLASKKCHECWTGIPTKLFYILYAGLHAKYLKTGHGNLVGSAFAWYADGRRFGLYARQHSFVEFGHEIISTAILSLPLIQEGQLSVTGERICTKYW